MRKTKIICTIGPSSDSEEMLKALYKAGMNTARLNFSHGTHEEHQLKIDAIKKIRDELNVPLPIMLDTKGPEYRIGVFENEIATINTGDEFILTTDDIVGNEKIVSVNYSNLINELEVGTTILVNDGLVELCVDRIEGNNAICKVIIGGKLVNKKSMCFPGKVFEHEFLSEQDKQDLLFGIKNDVDFVAASFVSTGENAKNLRDFLDANGGERICIIAKIENRSGVENVDDILKYTDLVILDIKSIDLEGYKKITGKSMDEFNYFKDKLKENNTRLWLRQVIVPGINDTEEYILKLKEYIKDFDNVEKVELLPYHTMGVNKYDKLNIKYRLDGIEDMDKKRLDELNKLLK